MTEFRAEDPSLASFGHFKYRTRQVGINTLLLVLALTTCRCSPGTIPEQFRIAPQDSHDRHASSGSITVHSAEVGATVSDSIMGAGMGVWYNITLSGLAKSFENAGMTATRWPGGKQADHYHWQSNSDGPGNCAGNANHDSTFDNFMHDFGERYVSGYQAVSSVDRLNNASFES